MVSIGIEYVKVFGLDGTWKPAVSYPRLPFGLDLLCWNLVAKTVGCFSLSLLRFQEPIPVANLIHVHL